MSRHTDYTAGCAVRAFMIALGKSPSRVWQNRHVNFRSVKCYGTGDNIIDQADAQRIREMMRIIDAPCTVYVNHPSNRQSWGPRCSIIVRIPYTKNKSR